MSRNRTEAELRSDRAEAFEEFHIQNNLSQFLWLSGNSATCPIQREDMYERSREVEFKVGALDRLVNHLDALISGLPK